MPSPRDIRRRIRSVSSTAQITKAMQMVAASKMRKAQQAASPAALCAAAVSYPAQRDDPQRRFHASAAGRARGPQARGHPDRAPTRACAVRSTPTCSAWRRSWIRQSTVFITAGRKAAQFVARTRRQLAAEFTYSDTPTFPEARAIATFARDLFLKGEVDAGPDRRHAFRQHADPGTGVRRYLPVGEITGAEGRRGIEPEEALPADTAEIVFEPSAGSAPGAISSRTISTFIVYHVLAECQGERAERAHGGDEERHRQRRELIKDLTLEYNKLRQGNITKELLEIAGGQAG